MYCCIKYGKLFFILLIFSYLAKAQDTLRVNLQQADSIFISNSFYLLASSMNIEAQKAQILQAKLYPNPNLTAEINGYDIANNIPLHAGRSGEKTLQLEQLIRLGGKRKSEIEMAKTNALIAELEFQQLVRQLKFRLRSNLFTIGQQKYLLSIYNRQLVLLDTLLTTYQTQSDKGRIPLKDVVRLKGAYLKLNNDRAELLKGYYAAQADLQTLLQTKLKIDFQFSEEDIKKYIKLVSLSDMEAEALQSRPEMLIKRQDKVLAEQYLQYQKRLAIPDVNAYVSYDQKGGAFDHQINTGLSVPLPFWNRNQGNIKTSHFKLKETEYELQAMETEIVSTLQNTYTFYNQTVTEYRRATTLYNEDFEITVKGMTKNFLKQNVSIIEFIDFFEAYNEVLTEITRIKAELVNSAEQLNLVVGKDIY
ncbi:MAG: TolC family protein [Bacteroidia bacterium]|nr:TolC family protein [Bacteroidia bacterium]